MNTFEDVMKRFGMAIAVILCYPLYLLPFISGLVLLAFLRYPTNFKPNIISTMPTPWFIVLMVFLVLFQIYLFVAMADSNHYQTRKTYWWRMVLLLFTGFDYDYVYDSDNYLLKQLRDYLSAEYEIVVELNWCSVLKTIETVEGHSDEPLFDSVLKSILQKISLTKEEEGCLRAYYVLHEFKFRVGQEIN